MKKNVKIYAWDFKFVSITPNMLGIALLFFSSISLAQHSPWTTKASMPTARSALCTAVLDGKIYAIGGLKNESAVLSVVEVYDPATDTWDSKTPMPTARATMDCAVVDGKIYVFGGLRTAGSSIISTVEVYDPTTNTWNTKAPLPTPRGDVSVEAVNGKIYVIGGSKRTGSLWAGLRTVEEYDPVSDTWTTKSNMPTARWSLGTCVIDGKIYAIGGNIQYPSIASAFEVYDPATDTWSVKAAMPTKRYSLSTCFLNGKIYAFGGWMASGSSNGDPIYKIVEEYDVNTDTWTRKNDMPFTIALLSAETLNGKIYLIGGTNRQHTFKSINNTFEYDPHHDLFGMIQKTEVDKNLVKPGIESVCITTKMNETTGITLLALINDPDGIPIDSLQLYDDGTHDDGNPGDSLYANVWPVPADEAQYYVDIRVTRIESDTVIHQFKNLTSFTTDDLIAYAGFEFVSGDTIFDPNENQPIKIMLKNNSAKTSVKNITAKITSPDTLVLITSGFQTIGDIAAGANCTSEDTYWIYIPAEYQPNTQIDFIIEIASDGYIFWTDTFSIVVAPTTINTEDIKKSIVRIYPNPAGDQVHIELSETQSGNTQIEVFDLSGKVLQIVPILERNSLSHTVNLSDHREGIYFIRISNDDHTVTEKIIKVE